MKKKEKSLAVKVLIACLVLALVITAYNQFKPLGFGVLSLSSASFTSNQKLPNSDFWSGNLWIATVVQNGMGQHLEGTIDGGELGEKSGTASERDLFISMDFDDQTCESPIGRQQGINVEEFRFHSWDAFLNPLDAEGQARREAVAYCDRYGMVVVYNFYSTFTLWPSRSFVVCGNQIGTRGTFLKENNIHSTGRITVSGDYTKTIPFDSYGQGSSSSQGYVGDKVYYVWNGYLTKEVCPAIDGRPWWDILEDKWVLAYNSDMNGYETAYTGLMDKIANLESGVGTGDAILQIEADVEGRVNSVNRAVDRLRDNEYLAGSVVKDYSIDNAILVVEPENPAVVSNSFTFYVKSDFLGVYQSLPDIRFEDYECIDAGGVSDSSVYATLKNYGESGCASIGLSCTPPFTSSGSMQDVCLGDGESRRITLPYNVVTTDEVRKSCKITLSQTSGMDSVNVYCTATPIGTCYDNDKKCVGMVAYSCINNYWGNPIDCSKQGKECRNGECVAISDDEIIVDGSCEAQCQGTLDLLVYKTTYTDPTCFLSCELVNIFRGVVSFTWGLLRMAASIAVALFTSNMLITEKRKQSKKKQVDGSTVFSALVIGAFAGFLVWILPTII